jgi:hypothetical protein
MLIPFWILRTQSPSQRWPTQNDRCCRAPWKISNLFRIDGHLDRGDAKQHASAEQNVDPH